VEPANVGVILDSSVLIAAERRGQTVRQILEQLEAKLGNTELGLSVVTIAELMHGAHRASTTSMRDRRLAFIDELCRDVPIHPVTLEMARLAGQIEGQQEAQGVRFAFEDLLIGAPALHLGFEVATLNPRHFQLIPGLTLVPV
jgi:predicted nucleic acid-binding protein